MGRLKKGLKSAEEHFLKKKGITSWHKQLEQNVWPDKSNMQDYSKMYNNVETWLKWKYQFSMIWALLKAASLSMPHNRNATPIQNYSCHGANWFSVDNSFLPLYLQIATNLFNSVPKLIISLKIQTCRKNTDIKWNKIMQALLSVWE